MLRSVPSSLAMPLVNSRPVGKKATSPPLKFSLRVVAPWARSHFEAREKKRPHGALEHEDASAAPVFLKKRVLHHAKVKRRRNP